MARFGSRGALATTLAVAALAGSGLLAYALWPGSGSTGLTVTAGPPPPTVSGSPAGPLALTPPPSAVAPAPPASAAPTTTAPPAGTTSTASTSPPTPAGPASTTAPVKVAAPMCATLPTSSGAVLGPGCYVEVALNHPSISWPPGSGPSTSSEQIVNGEVWDGLSVAGATDASGVNLVVTLVNHSTQTMVFPDGLAVSLTVAAAGAPAVHLELTDRSVTRLAPGGSLRLPGTVALTLPGVYGVGASVGFSVA